MKQPWFKDWFNSPYYHQLYFKRDDQEAAAFINQLINYLRPLPGCTILDVACGKGRHSIQLANKGFNVTGIDLSEKSIQEAKKYETAHLHFYKHDMREHFRISYFDYVFNFFTSFGYFQTEREHDNVVQTIAQALKSKGMFVMDYLNIHYAEDHLVPYVEKKIDSVNFVITKWHDETHFYKKIVVEDEKLEEPFVYIEKVAKFSIEDFIEMFTCQNLQLREIFGDYNFDHYDIKKSPRLIMIAKKIN